MIKFLGHAGFMYESKNEMILMDPWMSKEGAFDSSWYQFPSNHKLGDEIRETISKTDKEVYIYISHEHKDHFDVPFLKTLELSKINFITPKFRRDHVASVLKKLNPKSVNTPIDSEIVEIGNLEIRLFLDDQEIVRDSAIGLIDKDKDFTFLNLNDCKVYDRVDELYEIFGKFNVFTCQFSGAVFHPVCYDYPEKKYNEISESKVYGKFASVKNLINKFQPDLYIPAAGPPVFLDPNLIHINYQEVNIFSSPFKFKDYLNDEMPDLKIEIHVNRNLCSISIDSSGDSLHKRGYKKYNSHAPLNEVLAAGIILMSGWDKKSDLLDPMCGTGTILIEAAMIARNIAPNLNRSFFAFEKWKDWDEDLFELIEKSVLGKIVDFDNKLYGFDISLSMIKKAEKNIEISQVDVDIEVLTKDFLKSSKEDQDDLFIIINPPYDKRISADVKSLYKSIGDTLKNNYQFSDVWIITANLEAIKSIGLKTSKKIKLFNSNLESRLLNYKIYPGTKKVKN